MPHFVILGAGPCGMVAARHLSAKPGVSVTVIEKEDRPGGLCRSVQRDGYRFDLGGHRFISSDHGLVSDVRSLLNEDLLTAQRKSAIYFGGRLIEYPLRLDNVLSQFRLSENARIVLSYMASRLSNRHVVAGEDTTLHGWLNARFGSRLSQMFFVPYSEKLWGIPATEISADWAQQRISLVSLSDAALRLLRLKRGTPRTYARFFYYPRLGIGQIFDRMHLEAAGRGVRFLFRSRVRALTLHGPRIDELVVDRDGTEERIRPDSVISTIPLPDLVDLFPESFAAPLRNHRSALTFRAVRFINVFLDQPNFSDRTWTYVADPSCMVTRIQEPKRRSPDSAPADKTSLILEIPCDVGDEVWSASTEALTGKALEQMERLGFSIASRVTGSFSTSVEHGYPVYRVGYRQHRDALLAALNNVPNLITCGRQGGFMYIFMDLAMMLGRSAARLAMETLERGSTPAEKQTLLSMQERKGLIEVESTTAS